VRHNTSSGTDDSPQTDSEGEIRPDCQLRWRSPVAVVMQRVSAPVGSGVGHR
jgi:hypothetical protein